MDDEIVALKHNNTWRLVPRLANHNVVGFRWIFKIKLHADRSIERHKAFLVAQGFSQSMALILKKLLVPLFDLLLFVLFGPLLL